MIPRWATLAAVTESSAVRGTVDVGAVGRRQHRASPNRTVGLNVGGPGAAGAQDRAVRLAVAALLPDLVAAHVDCRAEIRAVTAEGHRYRGVRVAGPLHGRVLG